MGAAVEHLFAREGLLVEHLPPGFRFHPTDEEVINSYLREKVLDRSFSPRAMGEVDLNKCEPWELPSKALMGEKEWYFYCHKDKKYPTGSRTNRATEAGYWKATGKDKGIYRGEGKTLIGMKKTLVFYEGRAPKGRKTNWVMHEYRLEGKSSQHLPKAERDEWVVCRVTHKNPEAAIKKNTLGNPSSSMEPFHPDHNLQPLAVYHPSNPTYPAKTNSNGGFVGEHSIVGVSTSITSALQNPHQSPTDISFIEQQLNFPQYYPTLSPALSTFYPFHEGSNVQQPMSTSTALRVPPVTANAQQDGPAVRPWQCMEEQNSNQSVVATSPAISNDTVVSQQLMFPSTIDNIDQDLLASFIMDDGYL